MPNLDKETQEAHKALTSFSKEDYRLFYDYAQRLFQDKEIDMSVFELRSVVNQLAEGKPIAEITNMPHATCVLIVTTLRYWNERVRKPCASQSQDSSC